MSIEFNTDGPNDFLFEDVFNRDDIQRLQDEFADATGVASIIINLDGTPLTRPSNFTRLCSEIISGTEKGRASCCWPYSFVGHLRPEGPTVQPCLSCGLLKASAGIAVGGKQVATWLIGQVRDKSRSEEVIRTCAREIGADEEAAVAAFREVPIMSEERFQKIARMLFTFAAQISDLAYRTLQQTLFIAEQTHSRAIQSVQQRIADVMATASSEVEVYDMTRRELAGLMETSNFLIADYDEKARMLSTRSHLGSDEKEVLGRWSAEKSLTGLVIKNGKAMRFSKADIRELADCCVIELVGARAETWVGVPIQNKERVFGAIVVQSYTDPNAYDDWCLEVLQLVSNQLSVYLEKKHAEKALRRNEELFRTFFEQHSVGFAIMRPGGAWLRFNDQLCEMTGYSREELFQIPWRDIFHLEQREDFHLKDMFSGKIDSCTIETPCICRDGSRTYLSVSTTLLRRPDGHVRCYACIVQDISERKQNEKELQRHQEAIIASMAILAEHRDHGTGEHIQRTKAYVRLLLERSESGKFYSSEQIDLLSQAAVLHDIGKVGVPDKFLLKPGKLTSEEFEIVKRHTVIGRDALATAAGILGEVPFITFARQIIEYHHEKWDGTGYPHGLKGEHIPFIARVMAIADVYDALVSERPYKAAFPHEEAVTIIAEGAGTHFDQQLVEVFLSCADEFKAISQSE